MTTESATALAKSELRASVRAAIDAVPPAVRLERSAAACQRAMDLLCPDGEGQPVSRVMLFAPMPDELNVDPLVSALLAEGVDVYLPRCDWDARAMVPVRVHSLDGLAEVRPGLREPEAEGPVCPVSALDAVIVPGVAFAAAATGGVGRVGRGGGFYDRFLGQQDLRARTVGVAFDEQIVDEVPMEPHDISLSAAVTPTRVIGRA